MAPKKQDKPYGVTAWGDRLWHARDALGLSQERFGELCGVDRLNIWKLESGKVKGLKRESVELISKGLKVDKATTENYLLGRGVSLEELILAHRGKAIIRSDTHRALLKRLSDRVGLPIDDVLTLAGDGSAEMDELTELARRAVMGVVHVLAYPLETVIAAAKEVTKERGESLIDAEEWFQAIRKKLPARAPSGTHPSSPKIKAARPAKA